MFSETSCGHTHTPSDALCVCAHPSLHAVDGCVWLYIFYAVYIFVVCVYANLDVYMHI